MALVHFTQTRQTLIAYLEGELDHHVSQPLREQIDAQILSLTPVRLILDFSGISFMDSSGIGLILGRKTMMKVLGGKLTIQNPPPQIVRILRMAQIPVEITQEVMAR